MALHEAPSVVGQGSATVVVGFGNHAGIGVSAGVSSEYSQAGGGGTIAIRRIPVTGFAQVSITSYGKSGVAILAGISLEILRARTSGYTQNDSSLYLEPAAWLAVRGQWVFAKRFSLFVMPSVSAMFITDHIHVTGSQVTISTPPGWFNLEAGIGVDFF